MLMTRLFARLAPTSISAEGNIGVTTAGRSRAAGAMRRGSIDVSSLGKAALLTFQRWKVPSRLKVFLLEGLRWKRLMRCERLLLSREERWKRLMPRLHLCRRKRRPDARSARVPVRWRRAGPKSAPAGLFSPRPPRPGPAVRHASAGC